MRLWAIIFMFNYSKPSMISFELSNYYDMQLIITKYILAELIIIFAVNIFRMRTMCESIGCNVLGSVPTLIAIDSVWRISKRWLTSMEVRAS
jgi:hypothetical protein